MLTYVEFRTAKIWLEVEPGSQVSLKYWPKATPANIKLATKTLNKKFEFETLLFDLNGLEPGTPYEYAIYTQKKKPAISLGSFSTQEYWKWRKPAPDFSFITGSCSYVNDPPYDRPGRAYGGDSLIYLTMAKEPVPFMLWLGDSWYTRESDYFSEWGLWYRASHHRRYPHLQGLWKSMSHLGIWDDHDYGPNDGDLSYIFKEESRNVFIAYFGNPSYGMDGKGTYTKFSYGDVDIFLLDDRTWRSSDRMLDSINGQINADKRMFGREQMDWLKNALLTSNAPFKIIANGSQILNPVTRFDCLRHFPAEYQELMDFFQSHKVPGIVFLTGDRHKSEIVAIQRDNQYTLYDITTSALSAGIAKSTGDEVNLPERVAGSLFEDHNYARFSFSGKFKERKMKVDFVNKLGDNKFTWEISELDLRNKEGN